MNDRKKQVSKKEEPQGLLVVMRGLFKHVRIKLSLLIFIISLSIISSIANLFLPYLIQQSIDVIQKKGVIDRLLLNTILFFLFTILGAGLSMLNNYAMQILGIETMFGVRNKMFQHLQKLSFKYFNSKKTGKIISYLTNDVDAVQNLLTSGLVNIISQLFSLIGALIIMIVFSPLMSVSLLISVPLNLLIILPFTKRAKQKFKDIREAVSEMTAQTGQNVDGLRTIKSHATEKFMLDQYEKAVKHEREMNQAGAQLWSLIPAVNTFFIYVTVGATIIYGGYLFFMGNISVGIVFGYVLYMLLFFQPLGSLVNMFSNIQNAVVGGWRVLRLLETDPDMFEINKPIIMENVEGHISFKDVDFSYLENEEVIRNISIDVSPGERLAIVGPTGAGKTTLISLIPRFYDVKKGHIEIDGVNVKNFQFSSLRTNIGMVLQDNYLFSDTIIENIRYGKLGANDQEVIAAAKKAGAHPFIEMLPRGYNTKIGERGAILSIGQRQLIAFARTLLSDPPILILDEATSSVDAYSEILIQQSLENLLKDRTSIIIAHRLSTVVNSDTIIVMEEGKIIEKGNHGELLALNGLYKKLYDMQFAESEILNGKMEN